MSKISHKNPYCNDEFDRVVSSLMFHHLTLAEKYLAMKEIYRVLKPGRELHIADFGKPSNALMSVVSKVVGLFEEVKDNFKDRPANQKSMSPDDTGLMLLVILVFIPLGKLYALLRLQPDQLRNPAGLFPRSQEHKPG
ncbi:MAG TPA: class I SAM-dependent methyltransferase [Bacillota bacterium]|nr:class I SAM-dependent methyltransferase [Bacillota bacterium]